LQNYLSFYFNLYGFRGGGVLEGFAMSSNIALYSMILGKRTTLIPKISGMPLQKRLTLKLLSLTAKLTGILSMLFYRPLK
jgi:uncharacterized membrane protein